MRPWLIASALWSAVWLAPGAVAGADEPCRPSVALAGDPTLTQPLGALLGAHGIGGPVAGCPVVEVVVERRDHGLALRVRDTAQRESQHAVSNLEIAAALVESWARPDLAGTLMLSPPGPPSHLELGTPELVAENTRPRRGLSLLAAGETSLASDDTVWLGAQLTGCVRIGRLCIGVTARYAQDLGVEGLTEGDSRARKAAELLLAVELPYRLGRATLSPGLGAGVGWMRSSAISHDPTEPREDVDSGGLRANAHLTLAIPLTARLALDLGMSMDLAPLAHTGVFHSDGIAVPGEPRGFVRALCGLRLGEP